MQLGVDYVWEQGAHLPGKDTEILGIHYIGDNFIFREKLKKKLKKNWNLKMRGENKEKEKRKKYNKSKNEDKANPGETEQQDYRW